MKRIILVFFYLGSIALSISALRCFHCLFEMGHGDNDTCRFPQVGVTADVDGRPYCIATFDDSTGNLGRFSSITPYPFNMNDCIVTGDYGWLCQCNNANHCNNRRHPWLSHHRNYY